jgi:maltose O-acetyltransferase
VVTRSEKQKSQAGELYDPGDREIQEDHAETLQWLVRYNAAAAAPANKRRAILGERLAAVGPGCVVRPPFHCDFGFNIFLGANVFMNYGCIVLDTATVEIGDGTQIGPAVQIYAADHPRDPELRRQGLELGRPVHIGANVWIGGGAILLPGITIGADAVIGAGSVVTHDVPPGARVAGNPARLLAGPV